MRKRRDPSLGEEKRMNGKKRRKSLTAWLLVFCMVFAALPSLRISAQQEVKKVFCDSAGFENGMVGKGNGNGSGIVECAGDSENSYLLCRTLNGTNDYNWTFEDNAMKNITEQLVIEADLSTTGSLPGGNLYYRKSMTETARLMTFAGNVITFENGQTTSVSPDKWLHMKFVCNIADKTYAVYVDGEKAADGVPVYGNNAPAGEVNLIRLAFNSGNAPDTDMMIDNLKIYEEGEGQGGTQEPVVGTAVFYNSGGFEKEGQRPGGNAKNNTIAIDRDSATGNHYLYCETTAEGAANDYHWDLEFEDIADYMVFDFEVSTKSTLPVGNIYYRDADKNGAQLMTFEGNTVAFGGGSVTVQAPQDEWLHVVVVCNIPESTCDVYTGEAVYKEGAQPILNGYSYAGPGAISMMRIHFGANNAVGTNIMLDNLKVYEGAAPRDIGNDPMLNQTSKIVMNNVEAKNALGKEVVALSVGGNGIYYDGEKHEIRVPAYAEQDGRQMIPVEAAPEAFSLSGEWYAGYPVTETGGSLFISAKDLAAVTGKTLTTDDIRGIVLWADGEFELTEKNANVINNYLLYDRPSKERIQELFTENNQGIRHPRVMMNQEIYDRVLYNYANDPDVGAWGKEIIQEADQLLKKAMPTYSLPDNYRLLATCRDVYQRAQTISMAYLLTKDSGYAEGLYKVFEAVGNFPDWNPQHFLDVGEMTCAFAIGYDWLYDYWSEEQKEFLADKIYQYGLVPAYEAYYGNLGSYGWWTPGNHTNWNVVCNGGILMGAVAVFERHPEMCSDMIAMQVRDVETMMNSFYPDGAWFEGISYWEYTLSYTVNMLSTLKACFGTDFNLSATPGLARTIYFHMAGDGSCGLNNFHDTHVTHGSVNTYFWLSDQYHLPGVTNVRLNHFAKGIVKPTAFDLLWYDTGIKGTDFEMDPDAYIKGVELVSMRYSWVDDNGAFLSYHGGIAVENHSHLDTGTFVFDLAGIRWAQDLGSDNYDMDGYFDGTKKHVYYRLRPEGHNLYVINPDQNPGQTTDHFATVQSLVSSARGAYSVLDMTPAYADWVEKASRGYMLADDRRSGIVRDEITFKEEGSEYWWFMHTPQNAEIEIADQHTAYITKDGTTLKFMIDSDIADYEFGVMDAKPLATSPNPAGQLQNEGIRKLYLKGTAGKTNYVVCKMILAQDPCAEELLNTPIAQWNIPEGELQELPVLSGIYVDGAVMEGFEPTKVQYGRYIRYDDTSVPEITATAAAGLKVDVLYGETYKDTIRIRVSDEITGLYREYYYTTTVLTKLENVGEYTRMQVTGHKASDEPEADHPAEMVSDNNTNPESRWAAENDVWLILDMGRTEKIDAVGIAVWKGAERAYTFRIEVSEDGENWTEVIAERTTDTAYGEEIGIYDFPGGIVNARYVKYSGRGNSYNKWNSITELAILRSPDKSAEPGNPTEPGNPPSDALSPATGDLGKNACLILCPILLACVVLGRFAYRRRKEQKE